jgi:hypothetical protein
MWLKGKKNWIKPLRTAAAAAATKQQLKTSSSNY